MDEFAPKHTVCSLNSSKLQQQNCCGLLADKMATTNLVEEVRPDDEEVNDL